MLYLESSFLSGAAASVSKALESLGQMSFPGSPAHDFSRQARDLLLSEIDNPRCKVHFVSSGALSSWSNTDEQIDECIGILRQARNLNPEPFLPEIQ